MPTEKSDLFIGATKLVERRERWIEKDGTTAIGPRARRQPFGGRMTEPPDASGRRSHLLHQAGNKKAIGLGAGVTDVSRLPPVSAQLTLEI
jgi:hypothetical protein